MEFIGRVSFDVIYEKYVDKVFNIALKYTRNYHTSEEITQEVFTKFYRYMKHVNSEKIEGWLCVTAKNMALNTIRNKREFLTSEMYNSEYGVSPSRSSEAEFLRKLREREIENLTDCLFGELYKFNNRWYEAVTLTYILDKPRRDTAESMGLTADALNSMIYRAKKWMKKKCEDLEEHANKA